MIRAHNPNDHSGFHVLDTVGHLEVGVWEHPVGESTDTEENEVFVVLEGEATVTDSDGNTITLVPGTIGVLPIGAETSWVVTKALKKVFVTHSP